MNATDLIENVTYEAKHDLHHFLTILSQCPPYPRGWMKTFQSGGHATNVVYSNMLHELRVNTAKRHFCQIYNSYYIQRTASSRQRAAVKKRAPTVI